VIRSRASAALTARTTAAARIDASSHAAPLTVLIDPQALRATLTAVPGAAAGLATDR
jgi:hypothetical protein